MRRLFNKELLVTTYKAIDKRQRIKNRLLEYIDLNYKKNPVTLPDYLSNILKQHNLSKSTFADNICIGKSTLTHWLSGANTPSVANQVTLSIYVSELTNTNFETTLKKVLWLCHVTELKKEELL